MLRRLKIRHRSLAVARFAPVGRFDAVPLPAILALVAAVALSPAPAHAQTAPAPSADVRAGLESLERELAAEREYAARRDREQAAELTALQSERAALAARLLAAQAERERNVAEADRLKGEAAASTAAADALAVQSASIAPILREGTDQLRLMLEETPGSEAAVKRLSELAAQFGKPEADDDPAALVAAAEALFELMDQTHARAGKVTLDDARIFTARNEAEDVRLLGLGLARFAYVTRDGGRVGLAMSSPSEATGYRWTEDLPADLQDTVRKSVASLEKGEPMIDFPLDPLGRLEPGSLNRKESLYDTFRLGGPVMIPISLVGIIGILLSLERIWLLYVRNGSAARTADRVIAAAAAGDVADAAILCRRRQGTVPRVLAACLGRYEGGQRAMEDAVAEQLLHEVPKLQRGLGGIAVLAGVAPMLGLLGTVTGIISTFEAIRAFGTVNPEAMAAGISEALIATATGLIIAVPVVIVHSMLRGRADSITADAERYAAALLTTLTYGPPKNPRTESFQANGDSVAAARKGHHHEPAPEAASDEPTSDAPESTDSIDEEVERV